MSKKTELINVLQNYRNQYTAIIQRINEARQSNAYTDQGRAELINRIVADFQPVAQQHHDQAISIIDAGLTALADKWKKASTGKLLDGGYQAGLSNVLKLLEMGAIQNLEDIKNIIDTYREDFNALAAIRTILGDSSDPVVKDCLMSIPVDTREDNKRLLNQLRSNIDQTINPYMVEAGSSGSDSLTGGLSGIALALEGMLNFVTDRLGNDLELVPYQ